MGDSDSAYVFYDSAGHAHEVAQAEGGEQADPLMPVSCEREGTPPGLRELLPTAPGDPPVWARDRELPPGFLVLGTPLGSDQYKREALRERLRSHARLLTT